MGREQCPSRWPLRITKYGLHKTKKCTSPFLFLQYSLVEANTVSATLEVLMMWIKTSLQGRYIANRSIKIKTHFNKFYHLPKITIFWHSIWCFESIDPQLVRAVIIARLVTNFRVADLFGVYRYLCKDFINNRQRTWYMGLGVWLGVQGNRQKWVDLGWGVHQGLPL